MINQKNAMRPMRGFTVAGVIVLIAVTTPALGAASEPVQKSSQTVRSGAGAVVSPVPADGKPIASPEGTNVSEHELPAWLVNDLSRSTEGLEVEVRADGSRSLFLGERFMSVVILSKDETGTTTACVDNVEQAKKLLLATPVKQETSGAQNQ